MIKMIKSKLLPVLAAGALLAVISGLTGCGSAPKAESDTPEAPSVTKKEVKEEPQDPPNVKFVNSLKPFLLKTIQKEPLHILKRFQLI